jgi:hypothetical protein
MDPDQRVVAIRRTARTSSGRIVEVNEITLPAHQWELVYEWPAEQSRTSGYSWRSGRGSPGLHLRPPIPRVHHAAGRQRAGPFGIILPAAGVAGTK